MKQIFLFIFLVLVFNNIQAQSDTIYSINNWGKGGVTQLTGVNPDNGEVSGNETTYITDEPETLGAAVGLAPNGYLYYIQEIQDNGGSFSVSSVPAYPTPENNTEPTSGTELFTEDINGSGTGSVNFRRLGSTADGWMYIVGRDESSGTVHMARFHTTPDGSAENYQNLGTVTLDGEDPGAIFNNGDLLFDGSGNLYLLANDDQPRGQSTIYYAPAEALSTTENGTTNMEPKLNVLNPSGNRFVGSSTGLALTSTGNFYLAIQGEEDGGIYLLSQDDNGNYVTSGPVNNTNADNIGDLATSYFPENTVLPVQFGDIKAKILEGTLIVDWNTLSETNNAYFEVQVSKNGKQFTKAGTVKTKAANGNSDSSLQYSFTKAMDSTTGIMGISLLSLGFILLLLNRKNKMLMTLMMVLGLGLFITSCKKSSGDQIDVSSEGRVFVRIVQVDIDGTSKASDVVAAYKAD